MYDLYIRKKEDDQTSMAVRSYLYRSLRDSCVCQQDFFRVQQNVYANFASRFQVLLLKAKSCMALHQRPCISRHSHLCSPPRAPTLLSATPPPR